MFGSLDRAAIGPVSAASGGPDRRAQGGGIDRPAGHVAIVLVQSGLYPHAGYDERIELLTPHTFEAARDRNPAILLAPGVGAFPLRQEDVETMMQLRPIETMPGGLVAVRAHAERDEERDSERHRHQKGRGKH